jgi:hypothetical protein
VRHAQVVGRAWYGGPIGLVQYQWNGRGHLF